MDYEYLFRPGKIGGCEIKNRIILSPFNKNYSNRSGTVSQRDIDYFVERAEGGAGLLMVAATDVSPESKGHFYQQVLYKDSVIDSYRRFIEAIHAHGAKVGVQLNHRGRLTSSKFSGLRPVAPSVAPGDSLGKFKKEMPRELSIAEIRRITQDFVDAAGRAVDAGFDVVEIHGGHGYLINQFVSPFSNLRSDEYGGSAANRDRFAIEVVSSIRKVVGANFPVAYRMSADELVDGGLTLEDNVRFSKRLEECGVNLIDVSAGRDSSGYMNVPPMDVPLGPFVPYAAAIREAVSIPVSVVGRINDPRQAEEILSNGYADFICMARELHADPFFPLKAQKGQEEEIAACVGCLEGCSDRLDVERAIECTINPRAGRERRLVFSPVNRRKVVVVVGGGPAGMQAAAVCALRGHQVVLFERERELGGQIRYLRRLPHNDDFAEIVRYLSRQLKSTGVRIETGCAATPSMVYQESPDSVILATGGRPYVPELPGAGASLVKTYIDVVDKTSFPEKKAAVIGGEVMGCQLAEFLAERGIQVTIVEPLEEIATDGGARHKNFTVPRIRNNPKIDIFTGTAVDQITETSVAIESESQRVVIEGIDLVVCGMGSVSDPVLAEELIADGLIREVYSVGDCYWPGKTLDAMLDAAQTASRV